jgi:hypothetical protein
MQYALNNQFVQITEPVIDGVGTNKQPEMIGFDFVDGLPDAPPVG